MTESVRNMKVLKESHPEINVPHSIYGRDDRSSIYSTDPSIAGGSALEFDFDDIIVNSKVYRRVLASAIEKVSEKNNDDSDVIEGDLIDLSDSQTITPGQVNNINQDLECLVASQDTMTVVDFPHASASDLGRAETQISTTLVMRSENYNVIEIPTRNKIGSSSVNNEGHSVDRMNQLNNKGHKEAKFGNYYLGALIGDGDNAKVRLGSNMKSGIQVAIKLISLKSVGTDEVAQAKIRRQIAILGEFSHPNIVHMIEVIEAKEHFGIVLNYASGGELFDYIASHKYLKDDIAKRLFAQIISGLGYLDCKKVGHQNLNLHNLLLDGERNIIITGFGSAGTLDQNELNNELKDSFSSQIYFKRLSKNLKTNGARRGDLAQMKRITPCFTAP